MPPTLAPVKPNATNDRMVLTSPIDLLTLSLEPNEDGKVVLDIPVLPTGQFKHPRYGELSWTPEKFAIMVDNFNRQVTGFAPMLNEDHSSQNPMAVAAPAFGWPQELKRKPDGLYATVELTDLGLTALQNKRYRYISAEVANIWTNSKGEEFQHVISGMALTNIPFHETMPGLFSRGDMESESFDFSAHLQFATLEGDLSVDEVRSLVSKALKAEVAGNYLVSRYMRDLFTDFCIYEEYDYLASTCKYYQRAYTISGGVVTLGDDKEEVEEVWAKKARSAVVMSRSQQAQPGVPAATGEDPEGMQMSQAQEKPQTKEGFLALAQRFWDEHFGGNASQSSEITLGVGGEPAKLSGVATPTVQEFNALKDSVQSLTSRLDASETQRKDAELALTKERAAASVAEFTRQGKIRPCDTDQTEALEFAMADPLRFKSVYEKAAPVIDLSTRGAHIRPGSEPDATGDATTIFVGKVNEVLPQFGNDFLQASEHVARENPDLYNRHRAASTKKGA